MKKFLKIIRKIIVSIFYLIIISVLFLTAINAFMIFKTKGNISSPEEIQSGGYDCILVLGAGLWGENTPSPMLKDRLNTAIELYNRGVAEKLIMSGDHGQPEYDEVNVMKDYAVSHGVPAEDIFLDHAGFSTYDSMVRASKIFEAEKIVVVTQKFHLYRAIYISQMVGIDAAGAVADARVYSVANNFREFFARVKDFFYTIFWPEPVFLGEKISLKDDGNVTDG
ncbi:MAG: DUF218 domain-containing protein [Ruminococcaceae bacterium]|nr:DUF218 domain-containing protein [Oscillospiraceae bacterium]